MLTTSTEFEPKTRESFDHDIQRNFKYNVSCQGIFELDKQQIKSAKALLTSLKFHKSLVDSIIPDSSYIFNKSLCAKFKEDRHYDKYIINYEELSHPLAFTILLNENVEQFERMLKTIYRSQNVYCLHVDKKSSETVKNAVRSIAECFDNVFITTRLEYVVYASINRLKADLNCMHDLLNMTELVKDPNVVNLFGKRAIEWKYLINMAGSEFPLRTNYELVRILKKFNGSNVIEIQKKMNWSRVKKSWIFHLNSERPANTNKNKIDPPHNFTIIKNSAYNVFHRNFLKYALFDKKAIDLLDWANDTYSPDEW
jgi:hypothetical protein